MTRFEDKNENCTGKANYLAAVDTEVCKGCGVCTERCAFDAVQVEDEKAEVSADKCFGCGVCAVGCRTGAMKLERVERSHIYENPMELMAKIREENRK